MSRRHMADLSANNPDVDLRAYRAAGHRAVALKATEGVGFKDHRYVNRVQMAHGVGLHVVHYHFARPEHHDRGAEEANSFYSAVMTHMRPGDRLAIDLETGPGHTRSGLARYLGDYRRVLRSRGHSHLWLYTFTSYLDTHLAGVDLGDMRLWLADFRRMSTAEKLRRRVWAHQFTNGTTGPEPHRVVGVGHCDVSRLGLRAYSIWLK